MPLRTQSVSRFRRICFDRTSARRSYLSRLLQPVATSGDRSWPDMANHTRFVLRPPDGVGNKPIINRAVHSLRLLKHDLVTTHDGHFGEVCTILTHGFCQSASRGVTDRVAGGMNEESRERELAEIRGLGGIGQIGGVVHIPGISAAEARRAERCHKGVKVIPKVSSLDETGARPVPPNQPPRNRMLAVNAGTPGLGAGALR